MNVATFIIGAYLGCIATGAVVLCLAALLTRRRPQLPNLDRESMDLWVDFYATESESP